MSAKDKELLIKDLSARLPYGVIVHLEYDENTSVTREMGLGSLHDIMFDSAEGKPYLRPMSSMTEEEKEELKSKCIHTETEEDWEGIRCDVWGIQILDKYDTKRWDNPIWPSIINMDAIDWLNAHHLDYRDLIEKGLALKAPEGMYNLNEK